MRGSIQLDFARSDCSDFYSTHLDAFGLEHVDLSNLYIYINYLDTFTPESVYILNPNVKCSVNPDGPVPQDV